MTPGCGELRPPQSATGPGARLILPKVSAASAHSFLGPLCSQSQPAPHKSSEDVGNRQKNPQPECKITLERFSSEKNLHNTYYEVKLRLRIILSMSAVVKATHSSCNRYGEPTGCPLGN